MVLYEEACEKVLGELLSDTWQGTHQVKCHMGVYSIIHASMIRLD